MFSKVIFTLSAAALVAAPAVAANSPSQPSGAKSAAAPKAAEKKYCLTVEPLTGSRVEKTECKTKRQWAWEGIKVDQPGN